jgi:hypothetical protein
MLGQIRIQKILRSLYLDGRIKIKMLRKKQKKVLDAFEHIQMTRNILISRKVIRL